MGGSFQEHHERLRFVMTFLTRQLPAGDHGLDIGNEGVIRYLGRASYKTVYALTWLRLAEGFGLVGVPRLGRKRI